MKRTNKKPYWLLKEDKHDDERWRRQNRRWRYRSHFTYHDLTMWNGFSRPYEPNWKSYEAFRLALIEAKRDYPEYFERREGANANNTRCL